MRDIMLNFKEKSNKLNTRHNIYMQSIFIYIYKYFRYLSKECFIYLCYTYCI